MHKALVLLTGLIITACATAQLPAPPRNVHTWPEDWNSSLLKNPLLCGESFPRITAFACEQETCASTDVLSYVGAGTPFTITVEGAWQRARLSIERRDGDYGGIAPLNRVGHRQVEHDVVATTFTDPYPLENFFERSGEGIIAILSLERDTSYTPAQPIRINSPLPDKACVQFAVVWNPPQGNDCPSEDLSLAEFNWMYCCPEGGGLITRACRDPQGRAYIHLMRKIRFKGRTAELETRTTCVLQHVARVLEENPDPPLVQIQVHTDASNDHAADIELTSRQAELIRDRLIALGVDADRLIPMGYGSTQPEVQKPEINRRVVFMMVPRQSGNAQDTTCACDQ